MQMLSIYMILGIGGDKVFVFKDSFKQAKFELTQQGEVPTEVQCFATAYRHALSFMMTSSSTTCMALIFGALTPVPEMANFCIFAAFSVVFGFLLTASFTASCITFEERYMAGKRLCCCGGIAAPGTCCGPGCCFGGTRIVWRKVWKIDANAASDERFLERMFRGPVFTCVVKTKIVLVLFWLALLGVSLGVSFGGSGTPGMERDIMKNMYPKSHHSQRKPDVKDTYAAPFVNVVTLHWGLDPEVPAKSWPGILTDSIEPKYVADDAAYTSKKAQTNILKLCNAPDTQANVKCMTDDCLVRGAAGGACEKVSYTAEETGFTGRDFSNVVFTMKFLQDSLVQAVIQTIVISLCVAFCIPLIGTFNIFCVICYLLGSWRVLDWELDFFNVLYLIMSVGSMSRSAERCLHLRR